MKRRCLVLCAAAALLAASVSPAVAGSSDAAQKVLLYTYAQGFQHPSRYDAADAIEKLGKDNDFDTFHLDDPSQMEDEDWLNQYDALVFISTSGKALTPQGAGAMRRYIEAGGGYMGIHEASDTAYEYPWYGRLVGAYFGGHPFPQTAKYMVVDGEEDHPAVNNIPSSWNVYGEVYHFSSDPRKLDHTVVLTVDHGSYISNDMTMKELNDVQGSPHPIAWFKEGNLLDAPKKSVGGGVDNKPHTKKSQQGKGGDGSGF
ncbi:hypothetical protein CBOM_04235 [Ceraceosorus bombacis]|uniref:ThuA-like domain-containing protein n=1 Tax=Ceraceosorus bombacis TaxID=401625 RepID=A0A0P1BP73_9BASI|nr:hypothetical protein CBOM_04235 [Ceraceosorus bombacis]